jgi:3-oxoacyl-[acyl-carrier protein] reductase
LAARGAAVVVNYAAHARAAESVVADIKAAGGRAIAAAADVSDAAAVDAMMARAAAEFGPVTILVNNAGIGVQATLDTYDPEKFARMREVNVNGVINATRAVMAGMRERRYGRIVNIASIAGIGTALPGNAFYAATKAAVIILARRFAMELGPHGITVEKDLAARAMTGRIGEPDDIANAVAFLAAPESGWITAQVLTVDGGRMDYTGHA